MNTSLIEKILIIIKHIFSSYITIELFIFSILLYLILLINIKRKNKIVNIGFIGIYIGLFLGVFVSYTSYVKLSIKSFIKFIMNYLYFPSPLVYFFIILFVSISLIMTIFSKKITKFKRIFNYTIFNIIYLLFILFITLSAQSGINLNNIKQLYTNDIILSLIQVSNYIIIFYLLFTMFYNLYIFFKEKFD